MNSHKALVDLLRKSDGVAFKERVLPSGAVWVDIWKGNEFFVVECAVDGRVGISRVDADDGFAGHDEVFSNILGALEHLSELLASVVGG